MAIGSGDLRRHLLDELLPLWGRYGVEVETGCFHGRLEPTLEPVGDGFRRLLVQLRQIYVFSSATQIGAPGALDHALRGYEFLCRRFWDAAHGGFFLTLTPAGDPLDRRKDTYAHAFVPLALAAYYRASGDGDALRIAERVLALLEDHLADDVRGGFAESGGEDWSPVAGPRRQNPHMHLFEALLALHGVDPSASVLTRARRIFDLLRVHWVDPATGVLREHFTADWGLAPGEEGRIVEPGHHFEWVHLLHEFARLTDDASVIDVADGLYEFAIGHGIDAVHGGVYDQISAKGEVLRDGKRLWPQTEYVRALAMRAERRGDADARERLQHMLDLLWRHYLDHRTGGWREHLDRDLTPASERMNASSVYHVWGAISDAAAVLGRQEAPPG